MNNKENQKLFQETKERYQSSQYATQYKSEYEAGFSFKNIRSRIIAYREIAVIQSILSDIQDIDGLVLDIPCGTGKLGKTLSSFPVTILASDISSEMMALARKEYNPKKFKGFVQLNAVNIPYAVESVNTIICLRLFQRVSADARRQILSEFRKIVKSNLIISYSYSSSWQKVRQEIRYLYDYSNPVFFHADIKDIVEEIEETGFLVKKLRYVLPGLSSEVIFHAVP